MVSGSHKDLKLIGGSGQIAGVSKALQGLVILTQPSMKQGPLQLWNYPISFVILLEIQDQESTR